MRYFVLPGCVMLFLSFLFITSCGEKKESHSSIFPDSTKGMILLQHDNLQLRKGLEQHDMLGNSGYRLHNSGLTKQVFGDKWTNSATLAKAKDSGQLYYFDRISGGMPFQSLKGIKDIAKQLKDDPRFLGFQVHEWGNSPIHDYHRIKHELLDKGLSLNRQHFAPLEGRIELPYFSAGDYSVYKDLYKPLHSLADIERYLEAYFKQIINLTSGQVMSVTGFAQFHHTALRLGAKNIMPEIGSQVPLTALQIAFARGAAREYGKPFGVYYEPWGGSPFGCVCALNFSPWYGSDKKLQKKMGEYRIGPEYGSSRTLQRRLLFYSWLSGAAYLSEEWGAENYFSNWQDFPLTEYGKIIKDFRDIIHQYSRPKPVVPVALIMPPGIFGVDIRYIAGNTKKLYQIAPPDLFHEQLAAFARDVLAAEVQMGSGKESANLTPSPWISNFDVFSAEVSNEILQKYQFLVYFDEKQAVKSPLPQRQIQVYKGKKRDADYFIQVLNHLYPYRVQGDVGAAHARTDERYLLGIFNNIGITKTTEGEKVDPDAGQIVAVRGHCNDVRFIVGKEYVTNVEPGSIRLNLPAGEIVLLSFPDDRKNIETDFNFQSLVTAPYLNSDDILFLKEKEILIFSDTKNAQIYYTLDGSEPDKTSKIYERPFSINKSATLKMCAFVEDRSSPTSTVSFKKAEYEEPIKTGAVQPGISYNYYTGEYQSVKDFSKIQQQKSGVVDNFSTIHANKKEYFAFDFSGYIKIPEEGLYTFYLSSNDGSQLYLNNRLIIDHDGLHNDDFEKSGTLALKPGLYAISLKYFQGGGSHKLNLGWEGPGFEKTEIPNSVLFHKDQIFHDAVLWLEKEAHRIIRASMRTMNDGTAAFPPQVGIGYEAFWLRDYAYMLEGSVNSFSDKELIDACKLFVRHIRADGAGVDCIKFDETPIYKPGFGSMGINPVADGPQFTVDVAWHTYQKTGDKKLLNSIIEPLIKTLKATPRNPETHLVHIIPGDEQERCPYGFTDTIGKQGDILFCSLLLVQATRQLAELLTILGKDKEASDWRKECDMITENIRKVFWNQGTGLFKAATLVCKQPDIWGSAFAVYLGVANKVQAKSIATYFKKHYSSIVKNGQIRHLPRGTYWEKAVSKQDTYQNGAYWGTPTGWFVYTLDLVDPKLANQTVIDMVNDYKEHGANEWISDKEYKLPNYLASASLPLAGIHAMVTRRDKL